MKLHFDAAVRANDLEDFRSCLEELAWATSALFDGISGVRGLGIGTARAEDAIKVAAFGVQANDYLVLQEFLPSIREDAKGKPTICWTQKKFGHPGNWSAQSAAFCLKTFVEVALRIQEAPWIPGAIEFGLLYEHKVEALADKVEIVQEQSSGLLEPTRKAVVRTLKRGESLRAHVTTEPSTLLQMLQGQRRAPVLNILSLDERFYGVVEADQVRVTCIPREDPWVREHFPGLPEIDYDGGSE